MEQLTVKALYSILGTVIRRGCGDKKIVIPDDNEGNGYHGMFYGITWRADEVAECLDDSFGGGLYDSEETDPTKLVILG